MEDFWNLTGLKPLLSKTKRCEVVSHVVGDDRSTRNKIQGAILIVATGKLASGNQVWIVLFLDSYILTEEQTIFFLLWCFFLFFFPVNTKAKNNNKKDWHVEQKCQPQKERESEKEPNTIQTTLVAKLDSE